MTEKRGWGHWQEYDVIDVTEESLASMPADIPLPGGWTGDVNEGHPQTCPEQEHGPIENLDQRCLLHG